MGRLWYPANVPGVTFHNWSAGSVLATSIAHKGGLAGARALAHTVVECLADPDLVERAKQGFAKETKGIEYEPMIPAGNTAPLEINRDLMAQFRPLMEAHYAEPKTDFE